MQHYYLWTKNVLEKKSVIQYFFSSWEQCGLHNYNDL